MVWRTDFAREIARCDPSRLRERRWPGAEVDVDPSDCATPASGAVAVRQTGAFKQTVKVEVEAAAADGEAETPLARS